MHVNFILTTIISAIYPIIATFFLSWDYFLIIYFYWAESIVAGLFTVLNLAIHPRQARGLLPKSLVGKSLPPVLFFLIQYYSIVLIAGILIFLFFQNNFYKVINNFSEAFIPLLVTYGISFVVKQNFQKSLLTPYKRLGIIILTFAFTGFFLNLGLSPKFTAVALAISRVSTEFFLKDK